MWAKALKERRNDNHHPISFAEQGVQMINCSASSRLGFIRLDTHRPVVCAEQLRTFSALAGF